MSQLLKIPQSYQNITTVAIRGMGNDSDTVICTTEKNLMSFFNGYLVKKCNVEIEVKHLEPFVVYKPRFEVYYILHGDNKVVIVKDGTSFEIIKTYCNVYEMVISDYNNSGKPQLYLRTDKGYDCIYIYEDLEQTGSQTNQSKPQETSVVYTFCTNKLQQLQLLHDIEKNKISQKTTFLVNTVMQVSNDVDLSSKYVVTKNSWLKLYNGNLVYGFTVQNTSKFSIVNFNVILLEDNKHLWSKFHYKCWKIEKNKSSFDFLMGLENNRPSNIQKSHFSLDPESSILVASVMDDWSLKPLPYFVNGLVYIHNKNHDRVQYIEVNKIMVTFSSFLDKEFSIFVKNSILIEDLVTLYCTTFLSCYQIKCSIRFSDMKNLIANNFKFDTKQEWFLNSSLSWLKSIVCILDQISPLEYLLKVFSDSSVFTKTFIQVLSTILPEHTHISSLSNKVPTSLNIDKVKLDLRELRRVFKQHVNEQIIIPRDQWKNTRLKLVSM